MGDKGPDKWGSLDPKFKACSDGKAQSPIDLVRSKAVRNDKLKALSRDYQSARATLVNNGFNVAVSYISLMALYISFSHPFHERTTTLCVQIYVQVHFDESAGTMTVDGKNYSLLQMHWHTPSEHKMDGQL